MILVLAGLLALVLLHLVLATLGTTWPFWAALGLAALIGRQLRSEAGRSGHGRSGDGRSEGSCPRDSRSEDRP